MFAYLHLVPGHRIHIVLLPFHFLNGGIFIQISVAVRAVLTGVVVIVISLSNISGDNISIGHDHLHPRRHICPLNIYYKPSIKVVAIFRQQSKQRRVKTESQFVCCQGLFILSFFLSLSILIYLLIVGV